MARRISIEPITALSLSASVEERSAEHFDLLRVLAALLVFFSHQSALNGLPQPQFLGLDTWGGLGVSIFFSLSGYLLSGSWAADPSLPRFLAKRALRILPALAGVVLFCVFLLGPALTDFTVGQYLSHPDTWRYLWNIALEIRFYLPGVFTHNPLASTINGSLWTLPLEVACYLLLSMLVWKAPSRWRPGLLWSLAVLLLVADIQMPRQQPWLWYFTDWRHGVHYGAFFFLGAAIRVSPWIKDRAAAIAIAATITALLIPASNTLAVTVALGLPLAVIALGRYWAKASMQVGRWGDVSYGLYLYAFPMQQWVVQSGLHQRSPAAAGALALLLTFVAATLSWRWIERPALRLKPRRRTPKALPSVSAAIQPDLP